MNGAKLRILAEALGVVPRTHHVRSYALKPAEPPTEIQLWEVGENPTDYGVHRWTSRSAVEVIGRYERRGNPLQIDVEHNNAGDEPTGAEPQGGYARLELRDGAPWLVFDWSAYAVEQIRTRQRLFLSPEYDVDTKTGEIVALIRVSLVADPGTHHARMLASRRVKAGGDKMNLALILAALKAALANEDPEAAKAGISSLISEIEKMAGGGESDGDEGGAPAQAAAGDDGGLEKPAQAAAPPAPGDDDDQKKKEEEARRAAASAPRSAKADPVSLALAQKVARLEAQAAARALREAEQEAELRVAAAGERIPESLRAFAKGLAKEDFEVFVAGLPEVKGGTKGVRAAARPPSVTHRPDGDLDPQTSRTLARVFNTNNRPTESVQETAAGGIRLTHLARPSAVNGGK